MSLAPFVYAMGRGPGRARSLTREEAAAAMRMILSGDAAPEAVGALLMLMRYRGETAAEIAGFVDAAREGLGDWATLCPGLDWPCYAAGRSRGLPWLLLSAKLVAASGTPVLLHGWTANAGAPSDPRMALDAAGIALVATPDQAEAALRQDGIAFLPLEAMSEPLLSLLRLREVLGLRSAVNTVLRCLNPASAPATVQGVFHPPYRALQQEAGRLLGQPRLAAIKGGGGEFERHPAKRVEVMGLADGTIADCTAEPLLHETRKLAGAESDPAALRQLWTMGEGDPFSEAIVIGTAALALLATGTATDPEDGERRARALWDGRRPAAAA